MSSVIACFLGQFGCCAQFIADLFLFCYERDFMSNLHKSKQYDLIDMFNDTSR